MFNIGFFGKVAGRYLSLARELWAYVARAHWLAKPLVFVIFVLYLPFLTAAALIFVPLILLDLVGSLIVTLRRGVLRTFDAIAEASCDNFIGFVLLPPLLLVVGAVALIVALLPELASATVQSSSS